MSNDESKYNFKPVNAQALKALCSLPEAVKVAFVHALDAIYYGVDSGMPITHLKAIGPGVVELKINGSPAYRCVYRSKAPGQVDLLHAFVKTSEGSDRKNMETTALRYKSLS
ncbi:MAG: type II toxin-antitoxin system RelE/ParE family toxin [Plesiomonas sp.]